MLEYLPIRRIVALAAAYVVALQLVVLPLTVAAANPFALTLCSTSSADGQPSPLKGGASCACASGCGMQCCAPALVSPPSATIAIDRTPLAILAPTAIIAISDVASWRGPQNPRAPPQPAA